VLCFLLVAEVIVNGPLVTTSLNCCNGHYFLFWAVNSVGRSQPNRPTFNVGNMISGSLPWGPEQLEAVNMLLLHSCHADSPVTQQCNCAAGALLRRLRVVHSRLPITVTVMLIILGFNKCNF
jgi:hypothetical protein